MLPIERIDAEAFARWGEMKGAPLAMCRGFARAIEAEASAQDTALLRQLVEALEVATTPLAADRQEVLRAVTAVRTRLEGKR